MKRLLSFLTVVCLLFVLCACSGTNDPTEPSVTNAPTDTAEPTDPPTDAPTDTSETEAPTEVPEPMSELVYSSARLYRGDAGEVWVQAIVEIKNVSDDLLYCGDTTIDIEANGEVLTQLKSVSAYPQIIANGESAYYYEEALIDTDYDGEVSAVLDRRESTTKLACERYTVGGALSDSVYGGLQLVGEVTNNSDSTADMVCVGAILFGGAQRPIGLVYDYLTEPLNPGETMEYGFESDTLPEDITSQSVVSVEVFAFPLQTQ